MGWVRDPEQELIFWTGGWGWNKLGCTIGLFTYSIYIECQRCRAGHFCPHDIWEGYGNLGFYSEFRWRCLLWPFTHLWCGSSLLRYARTAGKDADTRFWKMDHRKSLFSFWGVPIWVCINLYFDFWWGLWQLVIIGSECLYISVFCRVHIPFSLL